MRSFAAGVRHSATQLQQEIEFQTELQMAVLKVSVSYGEVAEWLKAHAWKVCIRKRIEGSNPSLSANINAMSRLNHCEYV